MTEEQRLKRNEAQRKYKERNKEKVKESYNKWRQANLEKERERCRKYHHSNKDSSLGKFKLEYALLRTAKYRAKKTNREFNLVVEDIIVPTHCPVLGIELKQDVKVTGLKYASEDSPSLDRVDNTKGYIKGNVRVISYKANRLKSGNTKETLLQILNYLESEFTT